MSGIQHMYFDFHTFFRLAYLSLFKWRHTPSYLGIKYVFFWIGFFLIFPLFQLFNAVCFLLDEMIFPGYRKFEIKEPVFILGNPRSGTTFIHRVMTMDEERFFYFKTWEILFPAIIQKKIISFFGSIDQFFGNIGMKAIQRFESQFFHDFNKMHQTSLFYPEEDEILFMHIFSSPFIVYFFPFLDEFIPKLHFDQAIAPKDRRRIMKFYRNCIKRQAFFKGHGGHFLSKNPAFSPKIDSLYEFFPDCRIIYMARNPLEVIPAMQSLLHYVWHASSNIKEEYPFQEEVYQTTQLFYKYPLARLERAPESSYLLINYEDLVSKPSQIVQKVYQRFNFDITFKFLKILKEEEVKAKIYKSRHVYSLDQFNFTREQIISDFREIFDQFGFSTRTVS
ncbi:MAG: sulfotransferase [Thermodesulfobacteriota bacterium]|nr:sulfotransferase [Thermodesulfobacteriota bacterium]